MKKILYFVVFFGFIAFSCRNKDQEKLDLLLKGNEFLGEERFEEAIQYYDRAIKIDSEFVDAYNNRGVAYFENEEPGMALENYNQAIQLKPDYYEAIFNRVNAYIELNRIEAALRDLDLIQQVFPDTSIVYFSRGLAMSKAGDYSGAIESFHLAWELDPENPEIPVNIGTVFYYFKKYDSARYYLEEALGLDPEQGNAYNAMALMAIEQGNPKVAMILIEKALDFAPDDPYYLNNRGYIYLMSDSLEQAEADINESIRIDPYNGWAYRNKGLWYMEKGQPDDAVRLLKQASEMDASIDLVHFYLGNAYFKNGDLALACEVWKISAEKGEQEGGLSFTGYCEGL